MFDNDKAIKLRFRLRTLWYILGVVVFVAAGTITYFVTRNRYPLPSDVVSSVSFPIYYPSQVPTGYIYKKSSAKVQHRILFFSLQAGSKDVDISEQVIPPHPPDLTHLTGFKSLTVPAGTAAIGTSLGQPVAIILTDSTLITVSARLNVPNDVVANIASNMNSLAGSN